MALYKEIRQGDGVITNYHRILYLHLTTNKRNSIAVLSYVDKVSRESDGISFEERPYQVAVTYELPYDPDMTIESAYNYLKTLPQFDGATDI